MHRILTIWAAIALAVIAIQYAAVADGPATGTVTIVSSDTNSTTFEISIDDIPAGRKFKDIHFWWPVGTHTWPRIAGATAGSAPITVTDTNDPENTHTWRVGTNGDRLNVHTSSTPGGTGPGFGAGTYRFTVPWGTGATMPEGAHTIKWTATHDGNSWADRREGQSFGELDEGNLETDNLPFNVRSLSSSSNLMVPPGGSLVFAGVGVPADAGMSYEIYTSLSKSEDWSDALNIGINSTPDPVPAQWGLQFIHFTGGLNAQGVPAPAAEVVVPANNALAGETFYAVLAVKDSAGEIVTSTPVVEVQIQ